jgi:predicted small integral membrane protein
MTPATTLLLFKLLLLAGMGLWLGVIVLNNLRGFAGGVAVVGNLMGMQLFDQPPALPSPLLSRRIRSVAWHRAAYVAIVAMEIVAAALMAAAACGFGAALAGQLPVAEAVARGNLAWASLLALALMFTVGGAWFAYYVRQELMQTTHLVLIGLAVAGAIVNNLPA